MPDKKIITIFITLVIAFLGYTTYLYLYPPFQTNETDTLVNTGKMVWQNNNCQACHQIYGLGGHLGPDLTNSYSKRGPEFIKAFVMAGTPIMPSFKLNDNEMDALLHYLQHIDSSGSSDPRKFTIHFNGTIE